MATLALDIPERSTVEASPTLDDLIVGAWSTLAVGHAASCPICDGDLVPRYGSGPHPVGGACRSCGSELA